MNIGSCNIIVSVHGNTIDPLIANLGLRLLLRALPHKKIFCKRKMILYAWLSSVHGCVPDAILRSLAYRKWSHPIYGVILWEQAPDNRCPSPLNYFVQQNVPNPKSKSEPHIYKRIFMHTSAVSMDETQTQFCQVLHIDSEAIPYIVWFYENRL